MINIDSVYQTVQALANKEQRGYLTPQEFNLFAIQAQNDIFEQYLYDLDAIRAENPQKRELGDSIQHILFKLQRLKIKSRKLQSLELKNHLNTERKFGNEL